MSSPTLRSGSKADESTQHSDILIHAASIAYARPPSFSVTADGQPSHNGLIRTAFDGPLALRKRRVRPRMGDLGQPVDDDGKEGTERGSGGPREKDGPKL